MLEKNINSQLTDQQELLVLENDYFNLKEINYHLESVKECLTQITSNFFNLGYHLSCIKDKWDNNLTKSDFYKYCEKTFNLKSTSIKNLISVYNTFKDASDSTCIDERFEGFSFTTLVESLPLSDNKEFIENLSNFSSKNIRKINKHSIETSNYTDKLLENVFLFMSIVFEERGLIFVKKEEKDSDNLSINIRIKHPDSKEFIDGYISIRFDSFSIQFSKYVSAHYLSYYELFKMNELEYITNLSVNKCLEFYNELSNEINNSIEEANDEPSREELSADSLGYNLGLKYEDEIIPYLEDKTNINDRYNLLAYIPVLEVNIYQFKYQKDIYMIRYIQDGKIIFVNSDFDEYCEWELIDLMS